MAECSDERGLLQSPPHGENAPASPVSRRDKVKFVSAPRCGAYVAPGKQRLWRRARFLQGFDNRLLATRHPAHQVRQARPRAFPPPDAEGPERPDPEQADNSDTDCVQYATPIRTAGR